MTQKTTAADGLLDEMDSVPAPRTRRKPMLWQKLGEGIDPIFKTAIEGRPVTYFLTDGEIFCAGQLQGIQLTSNGKEYSWILFGSEAMNMKPTHYCLPQSI